MSIDNEIQQHKWESFRQKAVVNTLFTCRAIETAGAAMLKEHDLSMPQYNILRILRGQKGKPASVKLLTERMLDKSTSFWKRTWWCGSPARTTAAPSR
jgi:hypothetical protein